MRATGRLFRHSSRNASRTSSLKVRLCFLASRSAALSCSGGSEMEMALVLLIRYYFLLPSPTASSIIEDSQPPPHSGPRPHLVTRPGFPRRWPDLLQLPRGPLLRPVFRRVNHPEDMHYVPFYAIYDDVRQRSHDQFARAVFPSNAPAIGKLLQRTGGFIQLPDGRLNERWVMLSQIIGNTLQVIGSGGCPPNASQDRSIPSTRTSISSSSINSPRAIWSMPICTCILNHSLWASSLATASCISSSVPRPVWAASSFSWAS